MTDTQTMRFAFEHWYTTDSGYWATGVFQRDANGAYFNPMVEHGWHCYQAAWTRKPAAQVAGACELRGTGKCGCPTACRLNMAAMITAPMPIYTHPAPEPDATKVVSVPVPWQDREPMHEEQHVCLIERMEAEIAEWRALAADREHT